MGRALHRRNRVLICNARESDTTSSTTSNPRNLHCSAEAFPWLFCLCGFVCYGFAVQKDNKQRRKKRIKPRTRFSSDNMFRGGTVPFLRVAHHDGMETGEDGAEVG